MMDIPSSVLKITEKLNENGYEAYIVGGCVRDLLLGKKPNDFDITTNALPSQTKRIFSKTVDTGIKHGTVTVIDGEGTPFEVTTYRTENGYDDMRHPKNITFVSNIKDDLSRRDFTVNAMAYNEKNGLVDFFGGVKDIKRKKLKAVGNPEKRFSEDALRILRLFRFASTLSFGIERKTKLSAIKLCPNLKNISAERVSSEIIKTVMGDNPDSLTPIIKNGGLDFFGIENCKNLKAISNLEKKEYLRIFAFFKLCGCESADVIKKLKLKNSIKNYCETAEKIMFLSEKSNDSQIKLALSIAPPDIVYDIISYKTYIQKENLNEIRRKTERIIRSAEPYKISHLTINGDDIKALGYEDKEIGTVLEKLVCEVRKNPKINKKSYLLNLINKK